MACTDGVELLACIVCCTGILLVCHVFVLSVDQCFAKNICFAFRFRFLYLLATEAPRCRCLNSQWIMLQQHLYTPKKSNKNH